MSNRTVFLGGPITHAMTDGVFDEELEALISKVCEQIELQKFDIKSAYIFEKFGKYKPVRSTTAVKRDLRWISASDIAVIILPEDKEGNLLRSDGTHIEIGICFTRGMPILLLSQNKNKEVFSVMLQGMIGKNIYHFTFDDFFNSPKKILYKLSKTL